MHQFIEEILKILIVTFAFGNASKPGADDEKRPGALASERSRPTPVRLVVL